MWTTVLLIVVILLIAYIGYKGYQLYNRGDAYYRKKADNDKQKSGGTMDRYATQAIDDLNNIVRPAINDHFARAEIIRFNMLDNDIGAHPTLANIALNEYLDAMVMAIELGGIIGNNLVNNDAINQPNQHIINGPETMFMVHRVNDFGPIEFMIAIGDLLPIATRQSTENLQAEAIATSNNRKEAIDTYFDKVQHYTNDPQNSHDPAVNNDLRKTLAAINDPTVDSQQMIEDARQAIAERSLSDIDRQKALQALNIAAQGANISTLDSNEREVFAQVWNRSLISDNRDNKEDMQSAIISSLIDSISPNTGLPVCINGRCARYIGALAVLDSDQSIGKVMTIEAYRNQIYQETNKIIEEAIDRAAHESTSPATKRAGLSYTDTTIDVDELETAEALKTLKADIKKKIDDNINKYDLSETTKKLIRSECYISAIL